MEIADKYDALVQHLNSKRYTWLVTGVAGLIGTNLLITLLKLNQKVVGLDNFATGHKHNLEMASERVGIELWNNFSFIEGDICNIDDAHRACKAVDFVLHQAALGSVPRSIEDPVSTNASNIDGFLHMLVAARDAKVKRFVYAASSSTYGDHPGLPKVEDTIGRPLSPYAVTKFVNELYADVFARCYGISCIGLRYFNIFGPHQDPEGAYAAVIPKWVASMLSGDPVYINGDGDTSRDFCFIENAVQANLLAATSENKDAINQVYNVAVGERTTLNKLYEMIRNLILEHEPGMSIESPIYRDFRSGDVRHSLADISKAKKLLGYAPTHRIGEGLNIAMSWYIKDIQSRA